MLQASLLLLLSFFTAFLFLTFAPLSSKNDEDSLGQITGPYTFNLVKWELEHFFDKWEYQFNLLRDGTDETAQEDYLSDFFALSLEIEKAKSDQSRIFSSDAQAESSRKVALQNELEKLTHRHYELRADVEAILEKAISDSLLDLGIIDRIGPFLWPPVDFTFQEGATLLVRSPKDEIFRLKDVLMRADINLPTQIKIENAVEESNQDVSALVIRIGGLATYPSQVSPRMSLRSTIDMAIHEWTHHWLFFRPLGKKWWAGGDIRTINETVADIVAKEVGEHVYANIQGAQKYDLAINNNKSANEVFNFREFMLVTRLKLETLLSENRLAESEDWLETRRTELANYGFSIRKLNTAYFAFYGTYATDPRSGEESPLLKQIEKVRESSSSLSVFLKNISKITTVEELKKLAAQKQL